jgi:hypothetical protein
MGIWHSIEYITQGSEFGFEAVLAYLFKWYVLRQWICHDKEAAKTRFQELVVEVMDEYTTLS